MISDRELWACALQILRQYGDGTPEDIAERITDLTRRSDERGVATWKAIADRYDQLVTTAHSPQ